MILTRIIFVIISINFDTVGSRCQKLDTYQCCVGYFYPICTYVLKYTLFTIKYSRTFKVYLCRFFQVNYSNNIPTSMMAKCRSFNPLQSFFLSFLNLYLQIMHYIVNPHKTLFEKKTKKKFWQKRHIYIYRSYAQKNI